MSNIIDIIGLLFLGLIGLGVVGYLILYIFLRIIFRPNNQIEANKQGDKNE